MDFLTTTGFVSVNETDGDNSTVRDMYDPTFEYLSGLVIINTIIITCAIWLLNKSLNEHQDYALDNINRPLFLDGSRICLEVVYALSCTSVVSWQAFLQVWIVFDILCIVMSIAQKHINHQSRAQEVLLGMDHTLTWYYMLYESLFGIVGIGIRMGLLDGDQVDSSSIQTGTLCYGIFVILYSVLIVFMAGRTYMDGGCGSGRTVTCVFIVTPVCGMISGLLMFGSSIVFSYCEPGCSDSFPSRTVAYLAFTITLALLAYSMLYLATFHETHWQMLCEVASLFCSSLAILTFAYHLDTGDYNSSYMFLIPSITATLTIDAIYIKMIVSNPSLIGRSEVHVSGPPLRRARSRRIRRQPLTIAQTVAQLGHILTYRDPLVECVICLEEYSDDEEGCEQTQLGILKPCGHYFHYTCLLPVLFNSTGTNPAVCPLCRAIFEDEDIMKDTLYNLKTAMNQDSQPVFTVQDAMNSDNDIQLDVVSLGADDVSELSLSLSSIDENQSSMGNKMSSDGSTRQSRLSRNGSARRSQLSRNGSTRQSQLSWNGSTRQSGRNTIENELNQTENLQGDILSVNESNCLSQNGSQRLSRNESQNSSQRLSRNGSARWRRRRALCAYCDDRFERHTVAIYLSSCGHYYHPVCFYQNNSSNNTCIECPSTDVDHMFVRVEDV